jgi:hypothetical protein
MDNLTFQIPGRIDVSVLSEKCSRHWEPVTEDDLPYSASLCLADLEVFKYRILANFRPDPTWDGRQGPINDISKCSIAAKSV